jgi:hypothetical protein
MSKSKYSVNYYIKKFEATPESKWCVGAYTDKLGRHCALGHCGKTFWNDRGGTLTDMFLNTIGRTPVTINDSAYGDTPQERILIQLYNIKGYLS